MDGDKAHVRAQPLEFFAVSSTPRCCRSSVFGFVLLLLVAVLLSPALLLAQGSTGPTGTLTGTVRDPAGYLIPHAQITLTPVLSATTGSSESIHAISNDSGVFTFRHLLPGPYSLLVQATGFALIQQNVRIAELDSDDHPQHLDLTLPIPVAEIQVDVPEDSDAASTEHNGSAIILRPADLAVLSDDPDTMKQQLEAIAGPSPDGAHFFIDGFEGTRLPPKSDIREIRINSNLYSAQYDTTGQARIEIFTKPGTGKLHGGLWGSFGNSIFNGQDPIAPQPSYASTQFGGYASGPLGKRVSTTSSFYRFAHSNSSFIRATTLDGNLNPVAFTQAIPNLRAQFSFDPRIDFQAPFHTSVSLRYVYSHDTQDEGGIGGLSLASQSYRLVNTNQILQLLATNSFGAKSVNELRFQYTRTRNNQFAASNDVTVNVQGAFNGGGAPGGTNRDNQDTYELQDYFSHVFKHSFLRAGGRLRIVRDANWSNAGFNGAYTFPSLAAYQTTRNGSTQGASLFTITTGNPSATVSRTDGAVYAEDDWKVTPKFTTSLGLRVESQNVISDYLDFAPRASLAYALGPKGKPARFTLRAGSGIFYQRFSTASQLRIARGNGILQKQYLQENPQKFPDIPDPSTLGASVPTAITQISPNLRAPYSVYSGAGIDHPFGKVGSLSINYSSTHLIHAFETRNINAPLPGTYNPAVPTSGIRPYGGTNAIYECGSEGVSNQQALRLSGGYRKGPISLYAYYSYTFNNANTDGGFPSNSYDQHADYGRSAKDLRHQLYLYFSASLPFKFQTNTNMVVHSGAPFNITLGQDLNGDTQYNDRPTFATDLTRASVVHTTWGVFDTQPISGQTTIPINLGTSPMTFQVDERLSRNFGFGPKLPNPPAAPGAQAPTKPPPVRHKYSLDLYVYAENVLNHPNYTNPSGVLNSSLFGHPTADQGARALTFGAFFNF
jgi:hypothetical protein